MEHLRDIWIARGFNSTSLAAACNVTPATIYRMNRKEPVHRSTRLCVCKKLGLSQKQYDALLPCVNSEKFKQKETTNEQSAAG